MPEGTPVRPTPRRGVRPRRPAEWAVPTLAGSHDGGERGDARSCPDHSPLPSPHPAAAPPLIGIVTHELRGEGEPAWAPALGRRERDLAPHRLSLRLTYTQAVQEAGGLAVVVPTHGFVDETAALLDRLDGLVFSGGPDLDPAVYGQARHAKLGPDVDRVGDEYELALLAGAADRDLPVLGICRGMQALNVSRGGTLHQHLPDRTDVEHIQREAPYESAHSVTVARGSLLHWLTGAAELGVNSFHHQAADRIGEGLEVLRDRARRDDRGRLGPGRPLLPGDPVARRTADPPRRARPAVRASRRRRPRGRTVARACRLTDRESRWPGTHLSCPSRRTSPKPAWWAGARPSPTASHRAPLAAPPYPRNRCARPSARPSSCSPCTTWRAPSRE